MLLNGALAPKFWCFGLKTLPFQSQNIEAQVYYCKANIGEAAKPQCPPQCQTLLPRKRRKLETRKKTLVEAILYPVQ